MIDDIVKLCESRIEEMSDYLARGLASDYMEYKLVTGKIRGVTMAIELINDVKQKRENDDEF